MNMLQGLMQRLSPPLVCTEAKPIISSIFLGGEITQPLLLIPALKVGLAHIDRFEADADLR